MSSPNPRIFASTWSAPSLSFRGQLKHLAEHFEQHTFMHLQNSMIVPLSFARCLSNNVQLEWTGLSWECSCISTSCSQSSASCSSKNSQGSTSVTSFQKCNIPNATTHTTYLAVLPPVLNIFPVSCTLEAQQMEIAIGEKCFKLGLCVIFRCT